MKQTILMIVAVALEGCASTPAWVSDPSDENNVKIEAAIRKAAKKPTGELTEADLEKVTLLNFHLNQLTDVKGLENLTKLRSLSLHGNQLTDVKGLEKLTQLTALYLSDNKLTDMKGLEKLTQLEELALEINQLTNVKGLEKLTQLTKLNLRNNPALTKAQISELQKALPKCEIKSNPPLTKEESAKVIEAAIRKAAKKPTGKLTKADLEKVTKLNLSYRGFRGSVQLTDVQGLEKLTRLTELNLQFNQLTNVKGLEKLTQLKELGLAANQLTDVQGLEKLTKLTFLQLSQNHDLTKAQIDELKKALPKCKIHHSAKK